MRARSVGPRSPRDTRSRATLVAAVSLVAGGWSPLFPAQFVRGDADANGAIEITDAVGSLQWLFLDGAQPTCLDALDVDDDGAIVISDAVRILNFLFLGGPPPAAPFPECGEDPTADTFDCPSFAPCALSACEDCPARYCVPDGVGGVLCADGLESCEEIEELYWILVGEYGEVCDGAEECRVLFGHCGISLGGCWHVVGSRVSQDDLNALAARFTELGCFGPVCDCLPPPEIVGCDEGRCRAISREPVER